MDIVVPETDLAAELTERWVSFADRQRDHGSHILADENRSQIQESIVRHIVGGRLLVAQGEDILGFVMFCLESGGYEQSVTRGVIENLYVVPDRRSEGIGSVLLEAAERRLHSRNVDVIALEVMAANESARAFYEGRGYSSHRVEYEKAVDPEEQSDTHSKGDR